ncbi:unnamed protein product [Brachionus calyciflorus]|uniref:Uncharacterized protein n=1 Tax=Brachionus calyciflorus TaxID=104777 RepID=A0A813PLS5_9BILA|nr:unnamed protein product [Brachionus calyciflorus]
MTTGHVNPGYNDIVSRFNSAIQNPSGSPRRPFLDKQELEEIKSRSRDVWSVKDNSLTTYGWYFDDPRIKEKAELRPSSPSRRNNPHPKLVFLSARLKNLPGYFNSPKEPEIYQTEENHNIRSAENRLRTPSVRVYHNANQYLNSLSKPEAEFEETKLKNLGIDTDANNVPIQSSRNVISHFETKNDKVIRSMTNLDLASSSKTNRLLQLQSNQTNPYLYEDTRMYKEKYKNGDHGITFNNPRKPFRGDFMIHPDWHPCLKHHKLPYM